MKDINKELLEACEQAANGYKTIMFLLDKIMPGWRRYYGFHEIYQQLQEAIQKAKA